MYLLMSYGCMSISLLYSSNAAAALCLDNFPYRVYQPLQEALDAMQSDEAVTVTQAIVGEWPSPYNFYYTFEPNDITPTIGFIIYPGACVDPAAYAPAAHAIAAEGFLTVIVKMLEDLAILSTERASRIISDHPEIEEWIIGGHSLGGPSACDYIRKSGDVIDGVVLWASYPSEGFRVDDKIIKALSVYGSNDGLTTLDEIATSRLHVPPYTQWVEIIGGNHTQFGWYDTSPYPVQPDDNPADITREEQQNIIIQATVNFLDHFTLCSNDPENDYDNDNLCADTDNCPSVANAGQEDTGDTDGAGDACDNCSAKPNGPVLGTCVKPVSGLMSTSGTTCSDNDDCVVALGEICDLGQGDSNNNGCGDACECYADIVVNGKVELNDLVIMKGEFQKPCPPSLCTADLNDDNKVDLADLVLMKREFNRTGCPACL